MEETCVYPSFTLEEPRVWMTLAPGDPKAKKDASLKVTVVGPLITVELIGTRNLDANLDEVTDFMYDESKFKGRHRRERHFGFAGHNDPMSFRKVSVKNRGWVAGE